MTYEGFDPATDEKINHLAQGERVGSGYLIAGIKRDLEYRYADRVEAKVAESRLKLAGYQVRAGGPGCRPEYKRERFPDG